MRLTRVGIIVVALGVAAAGLWGRTTTAAAPAPKSIVLTPIGVYRSSHFDGGGAEIAAYDSATQRVFVVNLAHRRVDVLNISNPAAPFLADFIDIAPWGSQANSVAVRDGLVAVAIEGVIKTDPGTVAFFTAAGVYLSAVTVGALPDMLTLTPNGQLVLVTNEGEPNSYNQTDSVDPEGSVSIIDLRGGVHGLT